MVAIVQNKPPSPKAATTPKGGTPFVYQKGTPVPPPIAAQAEQVAHSRSKTTTQIRTNDGQDDMPIVPLSKLELGKLLGHGSYSSAYEIANHKGILKQLSPKVKANPLMFAACAADLVQEAQILHWVGHQHILEIYAWSGPTMISDYLSGNPENCYLVLEELVETLEGKLQSWQTQSGSMWYLVYEETNQPEYAQVLAQKCRHILGMALALEHLHQHCVLHRDLKPANIGFNRQGILKVFDFDLARVLPNNQKDELFQMTPTVGSPRYMAPEIKAKQKYNCLADVYSFGILVHQILTLEVPISTTVRDWSTHNKYIPNHWTTEVRHVMGKCLQDANHVTERPSMAMVVEELKKCPMPTSASKSDTAALSDAATEIDETTTDDVADKCCDKTYAGPAPPEKKGWFW